MDLLIDTVVNLGEDEFYRASRYNTHLAIILVNSKDKNIFDVIDETIRQTDLVQQLTSELIVIFLTHTDHEASFLCIDKIKKMADFTYTLAEYKGSRVELIDKLFLENEKKLI
ncbi:MAG: hypothetical protein L3J19_09765 [Sulfurimonas sp.]|nr:hypothetical protein [Sulfurimonas sp.]